MRLPDFTLAPSSKLLADVLPYLRRTPGVIVDRVAFAAYRQTLERLLADTRAAARSDTLAADLAQVMQGYRSAAEEMRDVILGLERVLVAVRLFVPVEPRSGVLARQRINELALCGLIEVLALADIANAVAVLQPASHEEASRLRLRLSRAFDAAIERASDRGDVDVLHDLREVHGWLVRDMIERGRPLARVITYSTGMPLPAVVVAHMLYQDAGRADELRAENSGFDHPSFMPTSGRALSR